jgi:hypothetical protein
LEACLHKAFGKYKCKALNKPLMLNHFLKTIMSFQLFFQLGSPK